MDIFKDIIDWMWENTWDSRKPVSLLYVVSHQPPVFRGLASPKQCIAHAIRSYQEGNESLAINWLVAGVAHDPQSRDELFRNQKEALDYASKSFGSKIEELPAQPDLTPNQLRDLLLNCMSGLKDREVTWKDFSEISSYKNYHIQT